MDFREAMRLVEERERNQNTSTFGDVVDMAQQGALQTLAGAANFVGAEKAASSLENWANEQYETLSPEMREAMAKDIINDDMSFGEGAKDWRTWLGTASNVLGGMAVTMLPAGAAGKAASMAGRSAAVSQGANVGTNALLNLAAGNGGQALNVQREIENIPYHELMDSPQFKRYVAEEADKNISDEEALNNARTRLAQEVGDSIKTDLTLGMVNLIGETVGDQAMVKLLKGSLGKTIKGAIGKGVLAEGGTEAVQGGVEQYRSNVHTNEKMDVEGDNSEGVGAAALESGLVGGLIGGGFGAPSGVAGRYRRRNFESKIEQAINPEVISQLRSVGKTDQEIEALLRPKIENRALSMGFDANESTALAHQALGAAMGKVPPAAERHATEDQAEAQQSVEPQQPEPVQPQQAQPQQPISEAAKQQEQAPVNLFSSDNHADLIRDGQQAVSAIKTWEKQDRGNDYAKQLRQDMSRYLATLNTDLSIEERQAAQRSMNSIYNEFLSAIGQKQKSPVDNEVAQAEMFDPETGEVMADSGLYHSQDAQRDKFELSQSIQRGELGFVDEIAAQDENFKQGLQRAMEISPAAVLQIAKARRDGSMSQEQAISALQRVINSDELKQVDQLRPTDEESFLRDQQAQERNAQQQLENRGIRTNGYQPNVEETPEFQRNQARVLQGMRQQAQTNSFAGGHQPNGERDVTPLATGIENQRVYDAPQVEFERWSDVNPKDVNRDERFTKLANEYDLNPVETEQERYRAPYIVAQEPISASIQEVEQRQPNRNARIQKKFDKRESQEVESYSEELPQTGDEYVYQSGEAAKRSELGRQLGKAQAEIAIKGRQKVNREQRIKNILEGKGTKDDLNWLDKEVNAQADSKKAKKPTLKIGQGIDGVDVKRSGNTTTLTPKVEKWNATIGERSVYVTQDKELKQVQIRLAEQEEPVTTFDYGKGSDMRLMDAIGKANQAADKYVSLIVKSNESYVQSEAEKAQSKGVVDQSLLVEERDKTAKAVDIWPSVEQRLDRGQMPTPEQMNVLQDVAEYINSAGKIYFTGKLGDLLRFGDVLKTRLSKYDALLSDEELEGLDREISDAKKAYQASDSDLSRQRATARLGRLNKIKDGKGTTEDLKWLRSELESERRGITTLEKAKDVNQTIAKERFAKAKTGKADNPRYQAYLDTLEAEELEAINSNAGYMSWITHRIAEFRDENGIKKGADLTSSQHKEFDKYLRDYADRHLSERVKSERDSTAKKAENKPTQLKAIPATISRKAKGKLSKISTAQKKVEAAQENLDEVEMQHSTDRSGVDMAHPRVKAAQSRLRTAEKAEQDAYNELGEVWKEYRAKGGNEAVWDKFINENQGHLDANSWEDLNLDFGEDTNSDVEIPEIPAKVPPFKDLSNPTVEELDALINYKQAEIAHYKARIANGENGEAMRLLINRLEGDIAKLEERKTNTKADKQEPSLIDTLQAVSDKYAENPTYRVKSYELEPAWKAVSKAMEEAGADTHDLYSFSNWITSQYQSDRQKAIDLAKSYLSDDKPEPTPPKGSKLKSSMATSNETDASKAKKGRSRPSGAREYLKAINALQSGEYTKEEAIELIDNYVDDVPALEEEFSQFTKPAIGNFFAQMGQWIDTSLRKDDLVKRAVKDIGNQFAAIQSDGGMFVVKSPSAMRNILSEMSDADYNKLAEKRKQQAIEREQEAERKKKALDNPQTLDDFQAYARANGGTIDAFNDQQLAEFDRLYTENQLSKLAEQEKRELERKAEVKAVETDGTIELSKVDVLNEAKGEQRYGAAFSEVDSDTFNDMRAKAKQLGGWYARAYKPKNLPARFDFKSEQARDDFLSVMGGLNVDQSERVKQRDQEKTKSKKEKQVEALREKAASLQAKADESNNAQRLTNTSRRAAMAASAAARADKQEAQANILRKIADGVESGEFLLLGNLTDISQLEELTSVMNRVKWDMPEDVREKLAYRDQQGNWHLKPETKFNQVARYVRFPAPKSTPASLEYIAREIENLDGYKMTAKSIRANIKGLKEHESVNLNGARWDKVIPKLRQLARSKSNTVYRVEHINELFKSQDRLIRMGIKGDITLRQALREYEQANNGKMSTQKEKTRLQKLTEKIEETVRGNRNAFNDFFPTPEAEVKKLIDLADIKPGMKVLEPSAGMGHIADQIAALNGVDLDVGELAFTLSELLEEKGHNVVAGDFLEYNAGEIYDRIVMNPPFSNDADIHHINHALTMLKDGGKLVAITSSMAGNRGNTTNKNFRRYLDEVGAEEINLDAGAFKNSLNPTNVATKIIVIEKPANDQYDDIRFSKASEVNKKPSTSLSPEKVTQAAQDWINQYDGLKGANVMVVPTMADLHELVETESNAIVKGAWLSGDNRVVLVAENLENVADVRRTLRHEFIAHNGLYANLDVAQQAQLTKKVNSLRNVNSLKGIFAEVDKSYRTAPEDVKAEEVIAKIAETESSVSQRILDKVLSWVLGALRRSGILSAEKITLSEVRNMINNVDSDLRKPNGMTTLSNVVRFSQTISSMDEDLAQQGDPIVSIADALAAKNESFYKQMLGKINVPFISKQFDALKNGGWALLNLRQMAEVGRKRVSREVGNILESYVNNKDLFTTRKTDLIEKVHKQADALNKFRKDKPQDAEATFSLLHDATLADVDPSKEYVDQTDEKKALLKTLAKLYQEYGGSQTKRGSEIWQERQALEREIKNEPKLRLKHKALREKFLQLSPDAQKVFTDVRDHYISQREEMDKALEERITDLAMAGNKRAGENTYHRYMMEKSRLGFYVPLARFGNYWIDAVDPSGERVFQMYETENAMMKDVKKLQAAGYKVQDDKNANLEVGQVRFGLKIQESRGLNGASASFVSDIIKAISGAQTNDKVKDQLTDEIYQMYLQTMPDRSIRKSFIHRKGVAGYSEDAARVLADQGVRQANQQARLETEKRFTDLMEELKIATDKSNNVSASRLYNEMVKRHEWMMNPQRAQWAQALTGFGFFWQIGISPASAMINLSQNWQIALPYIGSRFGFKETAAEMASLSGLFAKTFVAKKSKAGLRGDMDMTNGILGDVLNQEEREALRHAIKIGAIDVTQMADLTGMAEQESSNYTGKWAKAQQLIGAPFHWAEVMNREVCFITAYRMAKKNGLSKQESLDYATKATWDSHFDYSSRNRARFMKGDVAAVALQFKQYSQNMTYYLFSRFFDSIKGETPEVRKEARKQLLGTFAVTFAIGGLNALPVATIAAIANMAYAVAGDDNEPWDAETELKSLLAKTFGEDIAKGLYYGSMPSVSSRINIDLLRLWVQESDAQDSVGVAENILQQAAGASFGIAVSWARGLDYMTEGQYLRGVEYMTPKWIKDVFRTARYASEGGTVTNRNGEIIIDDVTLFEHAQQALGFTPARLVQQYDSNSALKGYERQVTRRRQSLMNAYWLAVRTKDNDGRKSVLNNIREFNRSEWGRQNPITNEVLSRSVKQHFKMASKSQNGAHYNQKYMKLLQEQQSW
ncbi:PLxRFG domain-containing protein [Vibrio parahaemolyticus]|nr:PLxRFG domain-containing protein [Vibrio parahaemolyticus]